MAGVHVGFVRIDKRESATLTHTYIYATDSLLGLCGFDATRQPSSRGLILGSRLGRVPQPIRWAGTHSVLASLSGRSNRPRALMH
jgi:hypothetical protein